MERQQQFKEEWQAAVDQLTTVIGVRQQLVDYLTAAGDVDARNEASVHVLDLVHYQKIREPGVVRGWDLDYTFRNHHAQPVAERLQVPDPLSLNPEQFAVIQANSRFEGDDHLKIFSHFRIDEGLHHHLREQGIDPTAANIRIEAIARIAPELSITSRALIVVGIMYTGANHLREIGTYILEPGGGFDPNISLHPRQFEILEQLAETISYDPRRRPRTKMSE